VHLTTITKTMTKFKSGSALNAQLEELIKNADKFLWLISPYIKLHQRVKAELKLKKSLPELKVKIVFGKGEDGTNKLSYEDAAFLKDFPDIEIRYEKNLHAKYYASEDGVLITSMNLYDYSQNNNIECGVWMEAPRSILGKVAWPSKDPYGDDESHKYFSDVIANSELLFKREAEFEKAFMSFQNTYKDSTLIIDKLDPYLKPKEKTKGDKFLNLNGLLDEQTKKFLAYSQTEKIIELQKSNTLNYNTDTSQNNTGQGDKGYCIRTGVEIPFNPKRPFCLKSYSSWSNFKNIDFPEKYCHKSGKASNGLTSFKSPVL
jgi:hypothetical protein